jgi:serine/threonine-protein kinase SRPK3
MNFMPSSLEDIFYSLGTVQVDDVSGVAAFMCYCLVLDPILCASGLELLNDKWLEHLELLICSLCIPGPFFKH